MFAAADCCFLYTESSLRVGSGEVTAEVDQPIQREAATGYPLVPASSWKGVLRARAQSQQASPDLVRLLGSAPESEEKDAGCVTVSDLLPLLFPVRSLAGLFAWVTSLEVWSRFQRALAAFDVQVTGLPSLPALPPSALVAPENPFLTGNQALVLEEMTFPARAAEEVAAMGAWLAKHAFPEEPAFAYWRQRVERGVVVLPEEAYRFFVEHATQIVPRIRIDPQTGTAADGSLWTEEYLPPETLLYGLAGIDWPAEASAAAPFGSIKTPAAALDWVKGLALGALQVGGGKTLGRGLVRVRWTGKKLVQARRGSKKAKKN